MTGYRERRLAEMRPYVEKARRMSGWTFDVEMSPLGPPMPWDYAERARELLADAASVLDIGTGGGERFSRILQGYDKRAVAMEGWSGNIRVAVDHLGKIGVPVVYGSGNLLPFRDTSFEVVLNRHEGFSPEDASRIAAAGGRVLTQQVGHDNWKEVADFFPGRQPSWGPTFGPYQEGFHRSGLRVLRADWHRKQWALAVDDSGLTSRNLLNPPKDWDGPPLQDSWKGDLGVTLLELEPRARLCDRRQVGVRSRRLAT